MDNDWSNTIIMATKDYIYETDKWWVIAEHKAYGKLPLNHTLSTAGEVEIFDTEAKWKKRLKELEINA